MASALMGAGPGSEAVPGLLLAQRVCFAVVWLLAPSQLLEWRLGLKRRRGWTAGQALPAGVESFQAGSGAEQAAHQPRWAKMEQADAWAAGSQADMDAGWFEVLTESPN